MSSEDQAAAAAAFGAAYAPWFGPHPGLFAHPGMLLPHPGGMSVYVCVCLCVCVCVCVFVCVCVCVCVVMMDLFLYQ